MNRDASPQQDVAIMSEDKDIAQADKYRKGTQALSLGRRNSTASFLHNVHTAQTENMNRDASPQQDVAVVFEDKDTTHVYLKQRIILTRIQVLQF